MTKNACVALLVVGIALVAIGGQGAIRLLLDHANGGLLGFLPGFGAQLAGYVVVVVAGVGLAGWADTRSKHLR